MMRINTEKFSELTSKPSKKDRRLKKTITNRKKLIKNNLTDWFLFIIMYLFLRYN
jgi:hypothetical protein